MVSTHLYKTPGTTFKVIIVIIFKYIWYYLVNADFMYISLNPTQYSLVTLPYV